MVVLCPKCKARLKVDETKLSPQGVKFRCPKCHAVLSIKKPHVQERKTLDWGKVLIAHSNPEILGAVASLMTENGYHVITALDGIDAMVKGMKELPALALIEVTLPKIYGFEVCKRLKARTETKEMKFVLIASVYDRAKYRREPATLHGADEYIEDHDIPAQLLLKVNKLRELPEEETPEKAAAPAPQIPEPPKPEYRKKPDVKEASVPIEIGATEEKIEKARRLSRIIINDIYLYNSAKVDESIRNDNFYAVFASEIKEGQKLYENRIPKEIRDMSNFYRETVDKFIAARKEILS